VYERSTRSHQKSSVPIDPNPAIRRSTLANPQTIRKHVFDNGNYIPLHLHVARVLHLDCNGHMEKVYA
jgi:hypothetical protein